MFKDQGLESQVSKLSTSFLVVNTTWEAVDVYFTILKMKWKEINNQYEI